MRFAKLPSGIAVIQRVTLVFLVLFSFATGPTFAEEPASAASGAAALVGHWEGQIEVPSQPLAIRADFTVDEKGGLNGSLDIPQQGASGISLEDLVVKGNAVSFRLGGIPGEPRFVGNVENGVMRGNFSQGSASFPFEMKQGGEKKVARRPQTPQPPFPYQALEVSFAHEGVQIAGTLTLPPGNGPFPALMLFSGSGLQDRDCTILDHKPFLLIADRLTRAGIAVLRVDDRGVGGSKGDLENVTTEDFIEDARAGIRFLAGRPEIDAKRIGIYGHSEGGIVAAGVAARGEVAFVVLASTPAVPGIEVIPLQATRIAIAGGMSPAAAAVQSAQTRESLDLLLATPDPNEARAKLRELTEVQFRARGKEPSVADRESVEQQISQMLKPWVRHFLKFDPATYMKKIKVPVLVLIGDLDVQVPVDQNLAKTVAALKEAGNRDVTVKELPGLNHLLQPAKTGGPTEYGEVETTMAPEALSALESWLREKTKVEQSSS